MNITHLFILNSNLFCVRMILIKNPIIMKAKQNKPKFSQNVNKKNYTINLFKKLKGKHFLIILLLFLTKSAINAQDYGEARGVDWETFVINDDASNHRAVLRLQDPNRAWILDSGTNLSLDFRLSEGTNFDDYGEIKMQISTRGDVVIQRSLQTKEDLFVENTLYVDHIRSQNPDYVALEGNLEVAGNQSLTGALMVGTDIHVDGTIAHFDGRVYISEENGTEEGFDSTTSENYNNFVLWVEEGIVSSDLALARLKDWPDYVFQDDYKLPSLISVEENIKEKGHLHTMPSAKEVEKNGFTVKDMTKRIVKTIEELTLHTIAQEKQIEAQNKLIETLSKRLEKLEQANK